MTEEEFYTEVARLLGCEHNYVEPASGNTKKRWGPREPGNGRFPGRGLVRAFSPAQISIQLHTPAMTGVARSYAEALEMIAYGLK